MQLASRQRAQLGAQLPYLRLALPHLREEQKPPALLVSELQHLERDDCSWVVRLSRDETDDWPVLSWCRVSWFTLAATLDGLQPGLLV